MDIVGFPSNSNGHDRSSAPKLSMLTAYANFILDVSGIGLGVFLIGLGAWALWQAYAPWWIWVIIIVFGIIAFHIHLFRYLGLKPIRKWFGL